MRHILFILTLLFFTALAACGGLADNLTADDATPVIRTDFSDEAAWKQIKKGRRGDQLIGVFRPCPVHRRQTV